MNFISKQARADKRLLDNSCQETKDLLDAARETAPPQLVERMGQIETYLGRLEIPNNNHGSIELSRGQRSREVIPTLFHLASGHVIIGESAIYMGDEQQSNHSEWLANYEVTVDPSQLVRGAIKDIRQKRFDAGRILVDPSRRGHGSSTVDAITVEPHTEVDASTRSWGLVTYELRTNPGIAVFKNAFSKGRDPLGLTLLHELAHTQQIIDQPAIAGFDSDYSTPHRHALAEVDAYRLVYHTMRYAYESSSSCYSGDESFMQLPAARDGVHIEELTEGLPFDEIPTLVLNDIVKIF